MNTTKFLDLDCVPLENASLSLLVAQSVGPRIVSLRFKGGENLFAELPDFTAERPDGVMYRFYGGHRLWHAPENMPRTYALDDQPVEIVPTRNGLSITQQVEVQTGIEKSIQISLADDKPQAILGHTLTNRGLWPVECAPWTITQLKTGGVAILPQSREQTEFLPNRSLALWPYTDIASPHVTWGNRFILVRAQMQTAFKVGFPNPRGWLAYWLDGTLFVKRAAFDAQAAYYDFGSSSECYCNDQFLELETLAPIGTLAPGESATHTETWELYADVDFPTDEDAVQGIIEKLGLE
ncbi:MAG: hypothetical protein JW963_03390 [Anaerolineales bacterium]|nr:hypothetical protein [Anaerolineales bacterium]